MFKAVLAFILLVMFTCRNALCYFFYPNMKINGLEWDGANSLTMDIYSLMFFICFVYIRMLNKEWKINLIVNFLLGYSFFDLLQRAVGIREFGWYDLMTLPVIILFVFLDTKYNLLNKKKHESE